MCGKCWGHNGNGMGWLDCRECGEPLDMPSSHFPHICRARGPPPCSSKCKGVEMTLQSKAPSLHLCNLTHGPHHIKPLGPNTQCMCLASHPKFKSSACKPSGCPMLDALAPTKTRRCEAAHGVGDERGGEEKGEASPSDKATSLPHGVRTVHAWRDHVQYSTSVLVRNQYVQGVGCLGPRAQGLGFRAQGSGMYVVRRGV